MAKHTKNNKKDPENKKSEKLPDKEKKIKKIKKSEPEIAAAPEMFPEEDHVEKEVNDAPEFVIPNFNDVTNDESPMQSEETSDITPNPVTILEEEKTVTSPDMSAEKEEPNPIAETSTDTAKVEIPVGDLILGQIPTGTQLGTTGNTVTTENTTIINIPVEKPGDDKHTTVNTTHTTVNTTVKIQEPIAEAPAPEKIEEKPVERAINPEELKMEQWLRNRGKLPTSEPSEVNYWELAYSGLNTAKFSVLEGKIGKFKFKRTNHQGNWKISIEE